MANKLQMAIRELENTEELIEELEDNTRSAANVQVYAKSLHLVSQAIMLLQKVHPE